MSLDRVLLDRETPVLTFSFSENGKFYILLEPTESDFLILDPKNVNSRKICDTSFRKKYLNEKKFRPCFFMKMINESCGSKYP